MADETRLHIQLPGLRCLLWDLDIHKNQLVDVLDEQRIMSPFVNIIYQDIKFDICLKDSIEYISIPAPIILKKRLNNEGFEKALAPFLYPYVDPNEQNIFI